MATHITTGNGATTGTGVGAGGTGARAMLGQRTTVGAGAAAKQVAEDARDLVRAEVALAKAEMIQGAKAKALGSGMLVVAAVCAWLALQGLLLTAGFALALVLPAWASALIISGVLLAIGGALAAVGKSKLATPVSLETTKQNVEEDVAWTRAHLNS